jgi:phage gp36-like protein
MQFATVGDFSDRWGEEAIELSNLDTPNATAINVTVLNSHLQDASEMMESYLWRYTLPFPQIPNSLRSCCLDIARYRAYRDVRDESDVRRRYEDWIKWLESVAAGKVKLGTAGSPPEEVGGGGVGEIAFIQGDRRISNALGCY